jgi:Heat induced stress protein YflT
MANHLAGLFPDRAAAEQAIVDLKDGGFEPSKIGVLLRDRDDAIMMARKNNIPSTEGAVTGGLIGGSLGALLAAVGAITIPGVGPFIAGGVLVTLIGGAAGWLVGALATLGIPKEEAEYYEREVRQGRALVTVDAGEREEEARAIMLRDGAEDLRGREADVKSPDNLDQHEDHVTDSSDLVASKRSLYDRA